MKLVVVGALLLVLVEVAWTAPPDEDRRQMLEKKFADAMSALTRATERMEEIISPEDREDLEDLDEDQAPTEDASVQKGDQEPEDPSDVFSIFGLGFPFKMPRRKIIKHWWEKENVCVDRKVKETKSNKTEESDKKPLIFMVGESHFSTCQDRPNKFVCIYISSNFKGTNRTEVTYTCCSGFRRSKETGLCEKVETKPVLDVASENGAGKFASLVKSAGLEGLLEVENITIFAPTDQAMTEYHPSAAALNRLETNELIPGEVVESSEASVLVQSHILPEVYETEDMMAEQVVTTEGNGTLRFNMYEGNDGPIRTVNCVKLRSVNHLIPAGVFHTVDKVLTTPTQSLDELLQDEKYSRFSKALSALDFTWGDGWTVLALGNDAMDKVEKHRGCAQKIIASHVLRRTVCKAAVSDGPVRAQGLRSTMDLNITEDGVLSVGEGRALREDVLATNGVLHELSEPYIPSDALSFKKLLRDNNYDVFIDLLEKAGLMNELEETDEVTLLLPSKDALKRNSEAIEGMTRDELRDLLRNHMVVEVNATAKTYTTKMNNQLPMNIRENLFSIFKTDESSIGCLPIGASADTCNGRVQVVKGILRPPTGTLYEMIQSMDSLMGIRDVLEGTKLEEELKAGLDEPVTILAPSPSAWMKLGGSNLDALLKDKELADQILRNHVVKGSTCCSSVPVSLFPFTSGDRKETLSGKPLVAVKDRNVYFGTSAVSQCDLMAKDGIIHTVDKVVMYKNQKKKNVEVVFEDGPKEIILGF